MTELIYFVAGIVWNIKNAFGIKSKPDPEHAQALNEALDEEFDDACFEELTASLEEDLFT
jgi:hypothetical protein